MTAANLPHNHWLFFSVNYVMPWDHGHPLVMLHGLGSIWLISRTAESPPPRFLVLRISRGFAVWVAQFFSSRSGQPCFAVKQSKARETLGQIMVAARKTHFGLMDTSHTYIHTCIFDVVVHIRSNSRGKGQVYPSDSCLIQNWLHFIWYLHSC